jgi:hypothetical protein
VSISIIESATFGAYLHITGEQSRFVPDLRVAILAAVFREQQYNCAGKGFGDVKLLKSVTLMSLLNPIRVQR